MIRLTTCAALAFGCVAHAQEVPLASPGDPRIRYVTYRADRSVVINVRRGVVTRLILDRDESIRLSGTGFPSRCEVDLDEWCIRALKGESQVWIKPKTGASHNNLELATDKRDYSIKLEVLPDAPKGEAAPNEIFRAIFVYPSERTATDVADRGAGGAPTGLERSSSPPLAPVVAAGNLASLGCAKPRRIVNASYSRDAVGDSIVPIRVFDDGVQTVFVFGDASAFPTVFAVAPDGSESRVNVSVDGNCLIAHQLGRQFVLRAANASTTVFNEALELGSASPTLRAVRQNRETLQ